MRLGMAVLLVIHLVSLLGVTQRRDGGPVPGELAPDFELNTKDGQRRVALSGLRGRPTVLIFGSYT